MYRAPNIYSHMPLYKIRPRTFCHVSNCIACVEGKLKLEIMFQAFLVIRRIIRILVIGLALVKVGASQFPAHTSSEVAFEFTASRFFRCPVLGADILVKPFGIPNAYVSTIMLLARVRIHHLP